MITTTLTKLLQINYPIIQAPIGSATTPALAAAVSNAGGMGTLALSWKEEHATKQSIRDTKNLTPRPFAVNLVLAFNQEERIQLCIQEQVPVVSFSWGDCTPYIHKLKSNNIKVCQTVATVAEALYYENAGVDFLIAQGWEAGGHILGTVATSVLIPAISDKVTIPVVAAGGIADGRSMLAALVLGASGVCMGTRFLLATEAHVEPVYQNAIINASENDTLYARRLFNIGWDHAPHRVLKNSTTAQWQQAHEPEPGNRPNENEIIAYKANGQPITRYSDDGPIKGTTGNLEALALYAGQTAGLCSKVQPAGDIVAELVQQVSNHYNLLGKQMNATSNL